MRDTCFSITKWIGKTTLKCRKWYSVDPQSETVDELTRWLWADFFCFVLTFGLVKQKIQLSYFSLPVDTPFGLELFISMATVLVFHDLSLIDKLFQSASSDTLLFLMSQPQFEIVHFQF